MPLTERLQIIQRQFVAAEIQGGVQERRGVAVGEHEAIAIRPLEMGRTVLHQLMKQQVSNGRAAQRRSGVAALGLLYRVNREEPQGINRKLIEGDVGGGWGHDS